MMGALRLEVSPQVVETFSTCNAKDEPIRALQLGIENNEKVVLIASLESTSDVATDCEKMAAMLKGDGEPCYFIFKSGDDAPWSVLSYVPQNCKPKLRMLYAASVETVRKALGTHEVPHTIHCTEKDALLWTSLEAEIKGKIDPSAYDARTDKEKMRDKLDKEEVAICATKSYVHGVKTLISDAATEAMRGLGDGSISAAIMTVESDKIDLGGSIADPITVEELVDKLPKDEPRFVLLRYPHQHEEQEITSTVFIYMCPEGCKVKLRMVYSTTKASVITHASEVGLELAAKLEYGDFADVTTKALYDAVHPPLVEDSAEADRLIKPKHPPHMGVKVMF
jgi:twinfilin-like protein